MRVRVFILILFLGFAVSTAVFSNFYVHGVMNRLSDMRKEAEEHADNRNTAEALKIAEDMLSYIRKKAPVLEMLTPHEDLHDLILQLNDVCVSLSISDLDDYRKAITLLKENTEHLISHESLSFSNIF